MQKVAADPKPTTAKCIATAKSGHTDCDSEGDGLDNDDSHTPDQLNWSTGPQWSEVFLPSLSHTLYVARNPFDDFKKDSPRFIQTVQQAFALSHPEIIYKFRLKDKFIEKASTLLPALSNFPLG